MHLLYTLTITLLTPFILLRLYWKGIKAPAYRQRWQERLAIYKQPYPKHSIWFHAVSVGETEAIFPLIKQVQAEHPEIPILVTTTTTTGSNRVQTVLGDSVSHVYLPYDLPFIQRKFFQHFQPKIALIMEKEIWPNLFSECEKRQIPLLIINARLSTNSAKNYKKIPTLVSRSLHNVSNILSQTEEDRQNFISIGAPENKTDVLGNLKFDITMTKELIAQGHKLKTTLFAKRFVWIAASTHKGEEEIILNCYQTLKKEIPELLLILVPRHPERFLAVKALVEANKLNVSMRSSQQSCPIATDIYIADTLGELKMLYAAADISFVGGSFVPIGGHNILESLAANTPCLFGPYMLNFKEISHQVLAQQASIQCKTESELIQTIRYLYNNLTARQSLVKNGQVFLNKNTGATHKTIQILYSYLYN